jgi:hypothetical protein
MGRVKRKETTARGNMGVHDVLDHINKGSKFIIEVNDFSADLSAGDDMESRCSKIAEGLGKENTRLI